MGLETIQAAEDVFNDNRVIEEPLEKDVPEQPKKAKRGSGRLFEKTAEETIADNRRRDDHQVGLLIGPKNLVRLRAFGFEVSKISNEPLSSGVAHRGLNE